MPPAPEKSDGAPPAPATRWRKTTDREPCPLCGNGTTGKRRTGCRVADAGSVERGLVWCRSPILVRRASAEGTVSEPGFRFLKSEAGGVLMVGEWVAEAVAAAAVAGGVPDVEKERDAEAERQKAKGRELARGIWARCAPIEEGGESWRVVEYLRARGIDLDRIPGGWASMRASIRFHPRCPRRDMPPCPAMVARVCEMARGTDGRLRLELSGIHRTFLDPGGEPRKVTVNEGDSSDKQMLGHCSGRAVWLGCGAGAFDGGAMVGGEGIETTYALMAMTGLPGLAFLSAHGMERWEIPPGLLDHPARGGLVHTLVLGCDFNPGGAMRNEHTRREWFEAMRKECGAGLKADRITAMMDAPTGLRAGLALQARLEHARPWAISAVRVPGPSAAPSLFVVDGEKVRAAAGAKSGVDWLDVANAVDLEAAGAALLDGVDLEVNARRCAAAPVPPEDGEGGTRDPGPGRGLPGDGGGDGGDEDKPWLPSDPESMPFIEDGAVVRARRYLWTKRRLGDAPRFSLARWGGKWWVYDGASYTEADDELMRSILWDWLSGHRHWKGRYPQPLSPSAKMAEEVVKALAIDTRVVGESAPAWLPPSIDAEGRPLWGSASRVERPARGRDETRGDPRSKMVFPNGVLDFRRLVNRALPIEERTRLDPHTPELFSTTCLPFELPVQDLRALMGEGGDRDEIYTRLCPKFYGWMADASEGDSAWEDQCLKMLGDTIGADRSIEKIFAVVGLQRGGKGILEDAIAAILGEENVAALDSSSLSDRFGLAHLVGKTAAIMPDAHLESFMGQGGMSVERLKAISGQGRIPIRDLYTRVTTHKLACRIWIFMNTEPELKDESAALAGRFVWLPITKSYLGREDASIKASVPAEAPGIMLLAIEGAIRLWSMPGGRRIEMCGEGAGIADAFHEDSAPLKVFAEGWLEHPQERPSEACWPTAEQLYNWYACFCDVEEKRKPLGWRKFFRAVKWHLRPFAWAQPRGEDDKRKRRLEGWRMRREKEGVLEEWHRGGAGSGQRKLGSDGWPSAPSPPPD